MPMAKPPKPGITWTQELPVKLKCAIADSITLYSTLESCVVELLWTLEQADLKRKQEIAKNWADRNFKALKEAVAVIPAQTDAIWPALKQCTRERNLIGHGVWLIDSEDRPFVVWHAKFLESNDFTAGEYFDWHRFDLYLGKTRVLLNTFAQFKDMVEPALKEEALRRQSLA